MVFRGLAKLVLPKLQGNKGSWTYLSRSPRSRKLSTNSFCRIWDTAEHPTRKYSIWTDVPTGSRIGQSLGSAASSYQPVGLARRGYANFVSLEAAWVRSAGFFALMVGSGGGIYYFYLRRPKLLKALPTADEEEENHTVTNWSNTHEVTTMNFFQPESLEELEQVVQNAHQQKQKIRPVGSGLSPNGIGLSGDGMVNLALMDEILYADVEAGKITVQAGISVDQLVHALRPLGLSLPNYASIKQQQIGGLTQMGAHGTGGTLSTLDDYVLSLKLVTPERGTLFLSPESEPDLFYFARCGLGGLGVVAEVTLQCVPRHRLLEYTFVTDMKGVRMNHKKWLSDNKHLRYMWIPDTDVVVVVQLNPISEGKEAPKSRKVEGDEKLHSVRELYKEISAKRGLQNLRESIDANGESSGQGSEERSPFNSEATEGAEENELKVLSDAQLSELSFTEMRDILIAADPLNREHIVRVNKAEADYWKLSEGYRIGWSDELLGFDCGGQQWVSEISLPTGTLKNPNMADVDFIEKLLSIIKERRFPAPAPIEQRWTASSRSPMSLASSTSLDSLFSWVGIIMYLPTLDDKQRKKITEAFFEYRRAAQSQLWDDFNAHEHWAKIEPPSDEESLQWVRKRLQKRFPVEKFNKYRTELDPNHILTNYHLDQLFPL